MKKLLYLIIDNDTEHVPAIAVENGLKWNYLMYELDMLLDHDIESEVMLLQDEARDYIKDIITDLELNDLFSSTYEDSYKYLSLFQVLKVYKMLYGGKNHCIGADFDYILTMESTDSFTEPGSIVKMVEALESSGENIQIAELKDKGTFAETIFNLTLFKREYLNEFIDEFGSRLPNMEVPEFMSFLNTNFYDKLITVDSGEMVMNSPYNTLHQLNYYYRNKFHRNIYTDGVDADYYQTVLNYYKISLKDLAGFEYYEPEQPRKPEDKFPRGRILLGPNLEE